MPAALARDPIPSGSNLAVLLEALGGERLGLYDGLRFVRLQGPDGTQVTVTIRCEREEWRVLRVERRDRPISRADFRYDPFQPAAGIAASRLCTEPVRTME